ncbi:hypothetical protein H072_768 [Dactylellina haptotyla CBS 200.50]|uniref:Methyltransferase type 12 domain-containing protein n=1 Tax=Dactylellina haptotyla (strain CBS 200.50) TaxID=1284197 RepID=S8AQL1_DACHA|nr:hypothetical protein H072_768 [Dactylellina haptotyla CBS 200.50]
MDAYDLWAAVYDTDGNVLQQLDDLYVDAQLPYLLPPGSSLMIAEFGCGTGRNTIKLARRGAQVLAVDYSQGMLGKLKGKAKEKNVEDRIHVYQQDLALFPKGPDGTDSGFKQALDRSYSGGVDGVVSTLVIEHLDINLFFAAVKAILKPEGWLLLTNMHADMGAISSAGFLDPETGKKIKPASINHPEQEILEAAGKYGFVLRGEVSEDGPRDAEHAKQFGKRAVKWIGIKMHIGMVLKLRY